MESRTATTRSPGFWGWLDERLGIGALRYPVPEHANTLAYREFQPGTDTQEIVAIILGAVTLLIAGGLLWRGRRTGVASP